ncbi:S1 family serine peptidase [Streptomyces sp. NPDC003691]
MLLRRVGQRLWRVMAAAVGAAVLVGLTPASAPAVVGGKEAAAGQFPYIAGLHTSAGHFCGGTVIGPKHVLTAANCVEGLRAADLIVHAGSRDRTSGGIRSGVVSIRMHPDYTVSPSPTHDIAVLTLPQALPFGDNLKAVPLADQVPATGTAGTIAGWGTQTYPSNTQPKILQYAEAPTLDATACARAMPRYGIGASHVCSYAGTRVGACQGDSGGPFVVGGVLVGVISWGIPCAKGHPDVHTSVPAHLEFIKQAMTASP